MDQTESDQRDTCSIILHCTCTIHVHVDLHGIVHLHVHVSGCGFHDNQLESSVHSEYDLTTLIQYVATLV